MGNANDTFKDGAAFEVVVISGHSYPKYDRTHSDFLSAERELKRMTEDMCDASGNFIDEYTFAHDDVILIANAEGVTVQAWQREEHLDPSVFSGLDLANLPKSVIGWQLVGDKLNASTDDPFDLPDNAVLSEEALDTVRVWANENGHKIAPVYENQFETPVWIYAVDAPAAPRI